MKNNFFKFLIILFFMCLTSFNTFGQEQFNFDVTEVEILDDGNTFTGSKRGVITTNDGISIDADRFRYDKVENILNTYGDVKFDDKIKDFVIFTDKATYLRNEEKIFTVGNSKAVNENGIIITADNFKYDKILNIFNAYGNVKIDNPLEDYIMFGEEITYLRNEEKIFTKGKTRAIIKSQYILDSKDVIYLVNDGDVISKKETTINDQQSNFYYLDKFNLNINTEKLKGEDVIAITNFGLPKSDKLFFSNAIINLKEKSFIAKNTKIIVDKNIFGNGKNAPRIKGVSSKSENNVTTIKKGIFTSCGDKGKCPPWSIQAQEIKHDKNKRQMIYNNAFLKVYNVPVLYFPKFFHPDPSVKRQSGFLKPRYRTTSLLGSSFYAPYFKVISDNKDVTIRPTYFDKEIYMLHGEYRQQNQFSSFIADTGFTMGYQSTIDNSNKNSFFHLFADYKADLNFDKFDRSTLTASIRTVNNDTYIKIFESNFTETLLTPINPNLMTSTLDLVLDNEYFNFGAGFRAYENLTATKKSDKFSYLLPYYAFGKNLTFENSTGILTFDSNGTNALQNTNNLRSTIINNFHYADDFISNAGFKNNYNFYFKNLNSISKNDSVLKEDPQISFSNIYEFSSSLPLSKKDSVFDNTIVPKISYRINPFNMKNHGSLIRGVNTGNIFDINRLGITDSFESGQSLTLGVNYKKNNLHKVQSFDYTLAAVLRDKINDQIPVSSTLNQKTSNIFGSFGNTFNENLSLNYGFALDNGFKKLNSNSISTTITVNNFVTTFSFSEENSLLGDTNSVSNKTSYKFKDSHSIEFATRRNRKINLTEFYDLIYEYKNDCLVAGVKYRKSYYEDRDIKQNENLLLTLTLIPLTTYERRLDNKTGWLNSLK